MQNGASPLFVASLKGHVEMVDKLLQHGARVDLQMQVSKSVAYFIVAYCLPHDVYVP